MAAQRLLLCWSEHPHDVEDTLDSREGLRDPVEVLVRCGAYLQDHGRVRKLRLRNVLKRRGDASRNDVDLGFRAPNRLEELSFRELRNRRDRCDPGNGQPIPELLEHGASQSGGPMKRAAIMNCQNGARRLQGEGYEVDVSGYVVDISLCASCLPRDGYPPEDAATVEPRNENIVCNIRR